MSDVKTWMKGIETLEPPDAWLAHGELPAVDPGRRPRRIGTIVVAIVVAVASIGFAIVALTPRDVGRPATEAPPAALVRLASRIAAENHDPTPELALWGYLPAAEADRLLGRRGGEPVRQGDEYVVVMDGDFACTTCTVAGPKRPRRPSIVLTATPGTVEVVDVALRRFVPSVANLHLRPLTDVGTATFTSDEVPWSISAPTGWAATTLRSPPNPDLMTGLLRTWVVNSNYAFANNSPGPNSGAGASAALGRDGVAVMVWFGWYPPDEDPAWSPGQSVTTVARAGAWHADAQNPGWWFRERRVCRDETCVGVVEWHGNDASAADVAAAQHVAESIELASEWRGSGDARAVGVDASRTMCDVPPLTGDVDGDGVVDAIWTGKLSRSANCPEGIDARGRVVAIDLGGTPDVAPDVVSRGVVDCGTWCVGYAITDLNADGTDEILINEGHLAAPVSGVIGIYELRGGRLSPVAFPDRTNDFALLQGGDGSAIGAYCRGASFVTWSAVVVDGGGRIKRLEATTYRMETSSDSFVFVGSRVLPGRELPARTGWTTLCGSKTSGIG